MYSAGMDVCKQEIMQKTPNNNQFMIKKIYIYAMDMKCTQIGCYI